MTKTPRGFAFVELLLVLVILTVIFVMVMKNYHKRSPVDAGSQKFMSEQGIDTTSYGSIKDSVQKKLQAINENRQEDAGN